MKKRAEDYAIGELLMEFDGHPAGTIISMADDPFRITRAYLLIRCADGHFSIFSCLKDAMCSLSVPRKIPEQVMKKFLWDAFVGMELRYSPEAPAQRVPVLDPLPEYKSPSRPVPLPMPTPIVQMTEPIPTGEESSFPKGSDVPEDHGQTEEIPVDSEKRMLPEFDFILA